MGHKEVQLFNGKLYCAHQVCIKCSLIRLLEISGQTERCFPSRMRPEIDKSGENASGEGAWSFE